VVEQVELVVILQVQHQLLEEILQLALLQLMAVDAAEA
jgi:hypothetical protein